MKEYLMTVDWRIPVAMYVIFVYMGYRPFAKLLANQADQIKRITVNMTFCAIAAALFALATGNLRFDESTYFVMGVGVLNAFANIMWWRAAKVSLAKTSQLSFGDDIIAMLLARGIIGDGSGMGAGRIAGMLLCISTGILFWWHDNKTKATKEANAFYRHVLAYCVLWGVAIFAQRAFAVDGLPTAQFVFGWYFGSFLTMTVVFTGRAVLRTITRSEERAAAFNLKDYAMVFLLSSGAAGGLAIEYWAKTLAPLTMVQPIFLVSEAFFPAVMAWWLFKEREKFDRAEWAFSALGFLGVVLLAFGFGG